MAQMLPRELLDAEVKSRGEKKCSRRSRPPARRVARSPLGQLGRARRMATGRSTARSTSCSSIPGERILCLEVKGGGIECQHGEWYGIHDGKRERIRDPFAQALDHRYDLRRKLDGHAGVKDAQNWLIGHARRASRTSPSTSSRWRRTPRRS